MNDDQIDDLKQFIQATVGQAEARLTTRIDSLEQKMDDGFAGVGEAIDQINHDAEANNAQIDARLTALEQAA